MSETKTKPQPRIASAEQMVQIMNAQAKALDLILAINNRFIAEMQKSTTLHPADEGRIAEWSRAVAKAHEAVERAGTAPDRPGPSDKLN